MGLAFDGMPKLRLPLPLMSVEEGEEFISDDEEERWRILAAAAAFAAGDGDDAMVALVRNLIDGSR